MNFFNREDDMAYIPKDYNYLKGGKIRGISDSQIEQHITLYKGYVAKLNEIEDKLSNMDSSKSNYSFNEYSELKRREAVPFNGTLLHELYFENLGATSNISEDLLKAFELYGGKDRLLADIKAAALCGPGWSLLTYNHNDNKLHTYFIAEHHLNVPINQEILLVLDSWEHAFMVDYGIKRGEYIDIFLENINWDEISRRFSKKIK
jgi:Fe-Mn family superoxide dismutase